MEVVEDALTAARDNILGVLARRFQLVLEKLCREDLGIISYELIQLMFGRQYF
jgi:hypothetical protein